VEKISRLADSAWGTRMHDSFDIMSQRIKTPNAYGTM
jgi:hypothetical protein